MAAGSEPPRARPSTPGTARPGASEARPRPGVLCLPQVARTQLSPDLLLPGVLAGVIGPRD